jgi:hypothetical protein
MENINAIDPAPIARGPQETRLWSLNPRSRHSEIPVVVVVRPIARGPNVAVAGAKRLIVNWQRRRRDAN